MFQVVKRDGEIAEFQMAKITSAIDKAFDAKEKVFAEVQGRKIELSKLTKKKRDAKPEQVK